MPDLAQLLAEWRYLAIGAVVVLGNVGLPVPEETVLILAGYLVWDEELRPVPTLLVGILSAAVGDHLGYWLGRVYGRGIITRCARWVRVPAARLDALQGFMSRYGAVSVVVARFVPGLRFLGGPLAGATGLRVLPFALANLVGAALFVSYAVGLGYAIGYGRDEYVARVYGVAGALGRWLVVAVVLTALSLGGRWVLRAGRR